MFTYVLFAKKILKFFFSKDNLNPVKVFIMMFTWIIFHQEPSDIEIFVDALKHSYKNCYMRIIDKNEEKYFL